MSVTFSKLEQCKKTINILALGRTGDGKSATLNSIMFVASNPGEKFDECQGPVSVTRSPEQREFTTFGLNVCLTDTVGLFDTELTCDDGEPPSSLEEMMEQEDIHKVTLKKLGHAMRMCSSGVHCFLMVVRGDDRFSREAQHTIRTIMRHFGSRLMAYVVFVVTRNDVINDHARLSMKATIIKFIEKSGCNEKKLDEKFVFFDNKKRSVDQVKELFKVIESNLDKQKLKPYEHFMYEEAVEAAKEEFALLRQQMRDELTAAVKVEEEKWTAKVDGLKQQLGDKDQQVLNSICDLQRDFAERTKQFVQQRSLLEKRVEWLEDLNAKMRLEYSQLLTAAQALLEYVENKEPDIVVNVVEIKQYLLGIQLDDR